MGKEMGRKLEVRVWLDFYAVPEAYCRTTT